MTNVGQGMIEVYLSGLSAPLALDGNLPVVQEFVVRHQQHMERGGFPAGVTCPCQSASGEAFDAVIPFAAVTYILLPAGFLAR